MWKFQNNEGRRYGREECQIEEIFPLKMAVINGNIEIVSLLLSHSEININEKALLKTVYIDTDYHESKEMTSSDVEQDLLSNAIDYNKSQVLNILLSQPKQNFSLKLNKRKRKICYESDDDYQMHNWQNIKYYYKIISNKELIKQKDLIFMALHKGNLEIIKTLSRNPKVDLSIKNSKNKTLLHIAVENQYTDIVKFLLSTNKIDVNAKTSERIQKTAFHIAVEKGNMEIIKQLLSTIKVYLFPLLMQKHQEMHNNNSNYY